MARASRWGNWDQSAGADAIAARSEDAATHSPIAAKDPASDQFDARGGSQPEGPGRRSDGPLAGTPAPSGPAHPPLGLDGFCPVSLVRENRWTKGDARFGVIHRGRTYLFAGPEEKEIFFADPDEYSPVLAGVDPVELTANGQTLEGRRAHGVVYQKRVYLFTSEQNLQQFWEEPERYARPIRQAMENGEVGRLFR
jgi:protein disulfide-isomerase